ncbi:DNA recombination protein RmuC, partial [Vibrio campbellii]
AAVASWWMKNKMQTQCQLLEQELALKSQLFNAETQQLKQSLASSQQELDELDIERDKAAHELKQTHGKMMAMLEKLRHFDALRQEREQYAR